MNHTSSASAAIAIKEGLYDAIVLALADEAPPSPTAGVDIGYGFRWPAIADDAVAVTSVISRPEDPNPGPKRTRYDIISVGVSITSWRAGWESEREHEATVRVYELLAKIDAYLRTGDNITLGGAALWVLLDNHDSAGLSTGEDAAQGGRLQEIAATFVARAYITNS